MNVKYVGPAKDYSGYGEANRHDVAALLSVQIGVTMHIPIYVLEIADFGAVGERVAQTENLPLQYDIIILHTTPNVYRQYMEQGKYHIARVFWETDKLPKDFAVNVQLCDEVWTGSEFNKRAIQAAGVTKPIYVIPEAIDTELKPELINPYLVLNKDTFKFYSIFEWTERKNPAALLEAYWREFEKTPGVTLTLKTYVDHFGRDKRDEIDNNIRLIKKKLQLEHYAPVLLWRRLMDRMQVYRFHKTFDCFVSPHRGEGWGIPQMEAMLLEKPIISTNCGGIHEYLTNDVDSCLVPYELIPLKNNSRNDQWYTPDQKWANVDINALRSAMRQVFDNQEKAREMGKKGRQLVLDTFSLIEVGRAMEKRLVDINNTLVHNSGVGYEAT